LIASKKLTPSCVVQALRICLKSVAVIVPNPVFGAKLTFVEPSR